MFDPPFEQLIEMLRKFLLVGLFVTVEPGTILQIAIGTVVSAAYFVRSQRMMAILSSSSYDGPLMIASRMNRCSS